MFTPLGGAVVQGHRVRRHGPAQRGEEPLHQAGAAARGQGGHFDAQRAGRAGQFGPGGALALDGAVEDAAERDGEERGRRVRPVVDVLRERGVGGRAPAPGAPYQRHGVDLQEQRRRAAVGGRLGVEDVRRPVRGGEPLRTIGVLVQQETEVGGGGSGGAGGTYSQEHPPDYRDSFAPFPSSFPHGKARHRTARARAAAPPGWALRNPRAACFTGRRAPTPAGPPPARLRGGGRGPAPRCGRGPRGSSRRRGGRRRIASRRRGRGRTWAGRARPAPGRPTPRRCWDRRPRAFP